MATITEVTLRNFRGFARLERLKLAPLTFLVGPNSAGKSSIADALLFMAQSGLLSLEAINPVWIGPLVDLGSFKDTVFRHEAKRAIEIGVGSSSVSEPGGNDVEVAVQLKSTKDAPDGRLKSYSVNIPEIASAEVVRRTGQRSLFDVHVGQRTTTFDAQDPWIEPPLLIWEIMHQMDKRRSKQAGDPTQLSALALLTASIQRVSSGRNPPQRSYLQARSNIHERRRLLDGIDTSALERSSLGKQIHKKIVEGLTSLGIADDLQIARISETLTELRMQDSVTGVNSNFAEFGYGASQVIPVLEGCAMAGAGPLFVEQPEIHLHPRAQGELAQILCDASKHRQMIVETHSEHMINRARRLIAEGKLKPGHVVVHYIDRDEHGSHAVTIGIDEAGDFTSDWPDGFYDERYRETMKIAEAQARRAKTRGRKAAR